MNTSTVHHTAGSLIYRNTQKVGDFAAYSFWATVPFLVIGFFVVLFTFDGPAGELIGYIYASIGAITLLSVIVMAISMDLLKRMRHFQP